MSVARRQLSATRRATPGEATSRQRLALREAVAEGLSLPQKRLSEKYLYDARGSRLFEAICRLPEYYPTRTELRILRRYAGEIAELAGPRCRLIELGSGASLKTRLLLTSLSEICQYVPIDISWDALRRASSRIRRAYPQLDVAPLHADYTQKLQLPPLRNFALRNLAFFPGSTLGNFEPEDARLFLRRIRALCGPGALCVLGIDLKKDPEVLHAAYNDAAGVTAQFSLNLLIHLNREAGTDFRVPRFQHYAFYNPSFGRIEMHLVSLERQEVRLGERSFAFEPGESIKIEHSYKYDTEQFKRLAAGAGFSVERTWTDRRNYFAVHFLRAGNPSP